MEPYSLGTSQFIMNIATPVISNLNKSYEQELFPMKKCNNGMTNNNCDNDNRSNLNSIMNDIDGQLPDSAIPIEEEDESLNGFVWNESDSSATYVGQNAWHIPSSVTFRYANRIKRLDLSYNCLQTLAGIEFFISLEELILDNNLLDDTIRFFYNPLMRILSINKNKITDLERFLNEISLKLPNLTYLSLLGNPACPDQLSSSDHDDQDYRRYRSYVVHRIPLLRFLDSGAIKPIEREEATQRGHYYRLIRLNSDSIVEKQRSNGTGFREEEFHQQQSNSSNSNASVAGNKRQLTPLPIEDDNTPKGGYGRLRHRYTGKHSEGNRFIRNHEL